MYRNFVIGFSSLALFACGERDIPRWDSGPWDVPRAEEEVLVQDAFGVEGDMHLVRLNLVGGKDYSLYAQWHSDTALIDPNSDTDAFELLGDKSIPSRITPHAPAWWGLDQYDHVLSTQDDHVYIGMSVLNDGTYYYDAIRYSASVKLPASVYEYFE